MTEAGRILGRGLSFPPRVGPDGRLLWSEGPQNVREAIRVILMTELRERVTLPEFGGGLKPFLFEPNTVTTRQLVQDRIDKALARWEPRIDVESVAVEPDPDDLQAAVATITYRLVATQARERVTLSVAFVGA
jgi:phage baseplate assembly protein W